jgi:hypothetical protein
MPAENQGFRRRTFRLFAVLVLLAAAVMLSGCIDVVQYISGSALNIDVYFRLTMQKSIFELAGAFGEEPQDLDAMFEEFDLNEDDVVASLPPGVEAGFDSINSDSEFGFELRYSAPRSALDSLEDGEAEFVPRISPWGIVIPLGEGNGSADSDEFADAILGSAKYRLLISKRLVSRVSEARILAGPVSTPVSVTELPDVWLLEFPMNLWYASDYAPTVEILF